MTDVDRLETEGLKLHTPEFEREIAETLAEREDKQRAWSRVEVRRRAERRERIATRVLPALAAKEANDHWKNHYALEAVEWADVLIDALDAAEARDWEATK